MIRICVQLIYTGQEPEWLEIPDAAFLLSLSNDLQPVRRLRPTHDVVVMFRNDKESTKLVGKLSAGLFCDFIFFNFISL